MAIYLLSASQISTQQPLSEEWMHAPIYYQQRQVASIDPDFRKYVVSKDFRRLDKLIKRALATTACALHQVDNPMPDAVIMGTGLGCLLNTEKFLLSMIENNESLLAPTHFIYSTHNTINSQIALHLKCHGYNNTYSQQGTSFDSALYDALMQFHSQRIGCALVGSYDEMIDHYAQILEKLSNLKHISTDTLPYRGEVAVCMVLSAQSAPNAWCTIDGMELLYRPTSQRLHDELFNLLASNHLSIDDIDTVMVGSNGVPAIDMIYDQFLTLFPSEVRVMHYKPLFGESPSVSGIGLYAAAAMLHHQQLPSHMVLRGNPTNAPRHILVYNQYQNRHHSLVLLSAC